MSTYLLVDLVVLALTLPLSILLLIGSGQRGAPARIGATLAIVAAFTAVFDSLMIAAGLFTYAPSHLIGLHIGLAPIEDFAYVLVAGTLLPALWLSRGAWPLLRTLLQTSRPLSWVNTAYPFAAAYLLAGGTSTLALVAGTVFFLIPYNLAMYGINDVFDHESDLRNPRKGGVEGALTDRAHHRAILWAAVLSCAPFLVLLLALGTPASGLALLVSMAAVLAYSAPHLRFKEIPFLDSATSATHFVGPAVVGLLLAGPTAGGIGLPVLAALVAFFCWSMASQAFGAVQDIIADREAGLGSVATVLGARRTVALAIALYLLAAGAMLLTPGTYRLLALVPLVYVANVLPFLSLRDADAERANAGWRRFLWLNFLAGAAVTIAMLWENRA